MVHQIILANFVFQKIKTIAFVIQVILELADLKIKVYQLIVGKVSSMQLFDFRQREVF